MKLIPKAFRLTEIDIDNIKTIKEMNNFINEVDAVRFALTNTVEKIPRNTIPVIIQPELLPPSREGYQYSIADIDFICSSENNICPKCLYTEKTEVQLKSCGHLKEGGP